MSDRETNERVVRESIDAVNRGDEDALVAFSAPDVTLWARRSAITGPFQGHAGARAFLADNRASFAAFRIDVEQLHSLDDERVEVKGLVIVVGHDGVTGEVATRIIYRLRDGLLFEVRDMSTAE